MAKQYDFAQIMPQLTATVVAMDQTFTSHEFINKFARKYPRHYTDVLSAYRNAKQNPFVAAHLGLSKSLGIVPHVTKIGQVPSKDFYGNSNTCAQWKKV